MIGTFGMDCDAAGDNSEDEAKSLSFSFQKLQQMSNNNLRLIIHGCITDSGGGGTLESLARILMKDPNLTLTKQLIFASFFLQDLQTELRNAITDVLGRVE